MQQRATPELTWLKLYFSQIYGIKFRSSSFNSFKLPDLVQVRDLREDRRESGPGPVPSDPPLSRFLLGWLN